MKLNEFLADNKISQKELAEVFGCNPSNISNITKGKRNVTKLQIRLMVERYGYDAVEKYAEVGDTLPDPDFVKSFNDAHAHAQEVSCKGVLNERLIKIIEEQTRQLSRAQEQISLLQGRLEKLLDRIK